MNCCSQEKETCSQVFLGEENMYTIIIRRRKQVLYCSCFQEKMTGAHCSTVLERRAMGLYTYRFLSVLSI